MNQFISNVLVAILSSIFSFFIFQHYNSNLPPEASTDPMPVKLVHYEPPLEAKARDWSAAPSPDFVSASKQVTDAVVNITASGESGFSRSNGSGVIFSRDGLIITNYHVVEDGGRLEVTLSNKKRLKARLIGADPTTDLALLKVEARDLTALPFGDSDNVEVGEWVLAVGNPFNLTSTVTAGIVSAKGRNLNIIRGSYSVESFIQTDAVVNPGNSGGALVNTRGELVGINTAIMSESGGYEGYSFAIPANLVRKVIADLRDFGSVQRAILGVQIRELNDQKSAELNLPAAEGVLVSEVSPGGSADRAGIRSSDVIISINGTLTKSVPELQEQVARYRPGDHIRIKLYRKGKLYQFDNVVLKGLPGGGYTERY